MFMIIIFDSAFISGEEGFESIERSGEASSSSKG